MTCMSLSAVRANSREGAAENYDLPFKHTVCCPASSTRPSNRPRLWTHNRSGNAWDSKKKRKKERYKYICRVHPLHDTHLRAIRRRGCTTNRFLWCIDSNSPSGAGGGGGDGGGGWRGGARGWDAQPSGLQSSYFLSALKTDRLLWLFHSPLLSLNLFDSPPAFTPSVLNNTLWQTANSKTFSQMYWKMRKGLDGFSVCHVQKKKNEIRLKVLLPLFSLLCSHTSSIHTVYLPPLSLSQHKDAEWSDQIPPSWKFISVFPLTMDMWRSRIWVPAAAAASNAYLTC